jgi:hypothetical protein
MAKKYSYIKLLLYIIFSLIYMEFILNLSTFSNFTFINVFLLIIFSTTLGIIFSILSSMFGYKLNYIVSLILIGLTGFIFSSQLIYVKIFKVFYTMYSAKNASQVMEFWREILTAISENYLWITLLFIPFIVLIIFGRRFISFSNIKMRGRVVLALCIVLSHLLAIGIINIIDRVPNSFYDLYYNTNYPKLSMEKLGLITTMRLDIQRLALGWSPSLDTISPEIEEPTNPSTEGNEEEVVEIEYNTLEIDFEQLIANEEDDEIIEMHKYFNNVQPTSKNNYTGKYEGYNLILITAEGFSPYAIHEEATPTLYKMVHEGYNFTNFYNPIWEVSTSDGEYVACTGLIPKSGVWSFFESGSNDMPFVMGNQLNELGYKSMAYHNHTYSYYKRHISHPNMGYDYKGVGNGLKVKKVWPASDLEMLEQTIPEYIDNQPFHSYYMTVSGHLRYSFSGNSMANKNKDTVKDLPYSETGKAYIATQVELDRAMEHLLEKLEDAGIADKTLIAISADHYPYGLEDEEIDELAGHNVEKNFELYKSPFILYTKGMEPEIIEKPSSSLDIIPTLSNLLGLEYDSRLLMGRDIFSDSEPLVIFSNRSYITDKGKYNSELEKFISKDNIEVDDSYINKLSNIINAKFHYSARILDLDYYSKVIE